MKKLRWLTLVLLLTLVMPLAPAIAKAPDETDGPAPPLMMAEGNWYIVEFDAPSLAVFAKSATGDVGGMAVGGKLNVDAPASQAYINQLKDRQATFSTSLAQAIPGARVERGYQIVLNAMAVELPNGDPETVRALWAMLGVKRVSPQQIYTIDLDYSLPLINASTLWTQLGGRDAAGAGIKVAVIDSGIDPDHLLFDGTSWSYPSTGTWPKGYCADHTGFCNGKIIATRYYTPTFEVNAAEELTPQDHHGHGTHCAGVSAGNRVTASYGTSTPEISGVAPGAWIMSYKGLFLNAAGTNAGGSNIMLVAAVEDAIADGADVINNSWGSTAIVMSENDPLVQAYEAAVDAGVVVVFSTGNAGPDYNTTGAPSSPKFIEVGASMTKRAYYNEVKVTAPEPVTDTLQSFAGREFVDIDASAIPSTDIGPLPYIPCNLLGNPDTTLPDVTVGITQTEPYSSTGWIALIPRGTHPFTTKLDNAIAQGADAVVMYTDDRSWKGNFTASFRAIYSVMIANDIGLEARSWWETYTDTARIEIGYPFSAFESETEDTITEFSSRGPWLNLDIKPDVVAPGENILSGYWNGTYVSWGGTSMAAPHVTGAAALLLQMHPTWTPAHVKSALMSTASQTILELDETTTADVMTQGSGRIDLSQAGDPGLTFDEPSHSFGMVPQGGSDSVLITATDVSGAAETYSLGVQETVSDPGNVTVTVTPATLNMAAGGTGSFTITVQASAGATVQDLEGNVVVSGTTHMAHIPYWLRIYEDTGAEVLLVDLDESGATADLGATNYWGVPFGDYTAYYTSTLDAMGITYDYWDVWSTPPYSPPRPVLDQYDKVIVYTGDYGGTAWIFGGLYLLDALDGNDFRNYLAAGGKVVTMGQDALGDVIMQVNALGTVDGLASYMRGAADVPLLDTVYGPYFTPPTQPSATGLEEFNPFLKDMILDMSFTGDGAWNQFFVDEVAWLNYVDLDTLPLFEVANVVTGTVESGYIATRSSYEPTIERANDPIGVPQEPVSWRVAFLAFGLEGVNNDTGYATRDQLLGALFDWLDDEMTVTFDEASYFVSSDFGSATLNATMTSSLGADAVFYRWDFGDGTGIAFTTDPTVSHQYLEKGFYWARVEAMDAYGHKAVSDPVLVTVGYHVYLPIMLQNYP
ncbi:MAG: S8 family serine peptidase [Anaerolineae bacterium]|nr:MAG: S8 family serine peptidase [Anaerolineae bacterium]